MMVTGLKLKCRKGQSTGLLVQHNVFCLGTRDPGSHLGAAIPQALCAGTWKTPNACRTVKCLALHSASKSSLQPGALSVLASTELAPRAFRNGTGTKQFSSLAVSRYHPCCKTATEPPILKHSYLQLPTGSPGSHPMGTCAFLKAPQG